MKIIRVVITESKSLTLLGLKWVIGNQPDMKVVASINTVKDALEVIKDGADVAILDSNLPHINDFGAVQIVQKMGCQVVVSAQDYSQDILSTAMQHNIDCLYL